MDIVIVRTEPGSALARDVEGALDAQGHRVTDEAPTRSGAGLLRVLVDEPSSGSIVERCRAVRQLGPAAVLVVTEDASPALVAALAETGADDVLEWPRDRALLGRRLRRLAPPPGADPLSDLRPHLSSDAMLEAFAVLRPVRDAAGRVEEFVVEEVNRRGAALLGRPREEVLGAPLRSLVPAAMAERLMPRYVAALGAPEAREEELSLPGAGGELVWLRHQLIPLGERLAFTARDVTARRAAEDALAQRLRYEEAIEEGQAALATDRPDAVEVMLRKLLVATGATHAAVYEVHEDAAGARSVELAELAEAPDTPPFPWRRGHQTAPETFAAFWREPLGAGHSVQRLRTELRPIGQALLTAADLGVMLALPVRRGDRWTSALSVGRPEPVPWPDELVRLLAGAAEMIGAYLDRRAATAALQSAHARTRSLLAAMPDLLFELGPDGVLLSWHGTEEQLFMPPEAFVGRTVADVLPLLWPRVKDALAAAAATGEVQEFDYELPKSSGGTGTYEARLAPSAGGAFVVLVRDVTERVRAVKGLRRSERIIEAFMRHSPALTWIKDAEGRYLFVNRLHEELHHRPREQVLGRADAELWPPEVAQLLVEGDARVRAAGQPVELRESLPIQGVQRDFMTIKFPLQLDDGPTAIGGLSIDVTERRQLKAQLALHDRLRSLGILAAGVAHEINNPMTFVFGGLELLAEELARVDEGGSLAPGRLQSLRENVAAALEGAARVRSIVADLRLLSRDEPGGGAVELVPAIETAARLANLEVRRRARLVLELAPVPPVRGTTSRLGQVFVNLLVNAAQAMDAGDPERNEIRVRCEARGELVVVEVADNGPGMADEVRRQIFDPFFTTKEVGRGTGLGLSICHGIVTALGGRIEVESTLGKGAIFWVFLPVAAAAPKAEAPTPAAVTPRRGRLLVVDDEIRIGQVVRRLLRDELDVELSTHPRDALGRVAAGEPFDAVLFDLVMPELTGDAFHRELTALSPALASRAACMTGDTTSELALRLAGSGRVKLIEKPFDADVLRAVVRGLLPA